MRSIVKYLHGFLTPSWQVVEMQIATKQFNDTAQGNNKYVVNPSSSAFFVRRSEATSGQRELKRVNLVSYREISVIVVSLVICSQLRVKLNN